MAKAIKMWNELVGNETQKYFLLDACRREVLPHFILFTGGYGTGKSTMANLLTKTILCENRDSETLEHCGSCKSCLSLDEGSNPAYTKVSIPELSGKADIKETINTIFKFEKLTDTTVFVLEEIQGKDKSTQEIQRALLDVLSNIPEDVYVISCTTRPYELLPELLNRAFTVELDTPTSKECESFIRRLCGEYGIFIEGKDVVSNLAEACGNSLRQISEVIRVVATDNRLTDEYLSKMFKFSKDETIIAFLETFIHEQDLYKYIAKINKFIEDSNLRSTLKRSVDFIFEHIVQQSTGSTETNYTKKIKDGISHVFREKSALEISNLMSILGKISVSDKESESKKLSKMIEAKLEFNKSLESKVISKSDKEQIRKEQPTEIKQEYAPKEVLNKTVATTDLFSKSIGSVAEMQRVFNLNNPDER